MAAGAAGSVVAGDPPGLKEVFLNIIPTNPLASLANADILPIVFFSLVFGIGLSMARDSRNAKAARAADTLFDCCSAAADVMYRIVAGIMQYAPIGVFVLIAVVFAQNGPRAIGPLFKVTLTVYAGMILHLILGYGVCLALFGLSLRVFLSKGSQAIVTAFVTRSSSGTLPVTLRVMEERLGAPKSISSFTLPVGATINMDGTSIYLGVSAMFIGYAVGAPLTFDQQLTVVITATLASIGTAGVPGAGAIMLLMIMDSINLPVAAGSPVAAAYAMILGIDAILDMGRTGLNVAGDMAGTAIVAKSERKLDLSAWK